MTHEYDITPQAVKEMLTGGGEFLPPEALLGDLTEAQALAVPAGSPYSIAGLVAHMKFWQEYNIAEAQGEQPPHYGTLDATFPAPQIGAWETLRADFLAGLTVCAQTAELAADQTNPRRSDTSVRFDLAKCPALHSAYHYGQIAMLRQIQGFWPPVGGDGS